MYPLQVKAPYNSRSTMAGSVMDVVFLDEAGWMGARTESRLCGQTPRGNPLSTHFRQVGWTHRCPTDRAAGQKYV